MNRPLYPSRQANFWQNGIHEYVKKRVFFNSIDGQYLSNLHLPTINSRRTVAAGIGNTLAKIPIVARY
jgi:hypothetical protein